MGETRVGVFQKTKTKIQWKNNNNNKKNNEEAEDSQKSLAVSGGGAKECAMFDLSLFCFSFCFVTTDDDDDHYDDCDFQQPRGEKKIHNVANLICP